MTHGQHDQGGWSQARYQRSVDKVEEHLHSVAEGVNRAYDRGRFDHLLVSCPHELLNDFRAELRTDVAELLAGQLSLDVGTAGEDDVLEATRVRRSSSTTSGWSARRSSAWLARGARPACPTC